MNGSLVSILIPAYNAQRWIGESIQSSLDQTWPNKEVIVVDDGSTDQTLAIARRFSSKAVKVITQANQGAAVARNTAYGAAQGNYIQWLDADDLLDPLKIEHQVRVMETEGLGKRTLLSGAWAYFSYRQRKAQFTPSPLWNDLSPAEWMVRKLGLNLHMQTDNWLVTRDLSDATGPWDCRLWRDNDGEYFSRMMTHCDGIRFIPAARSYYRRAGFTSITYIGGSNKKLESLFLSMRLHVKYLQSLEDSERTRTACVQYIRNWLHEFYPYRPDIGEELKAIGRGLGGVVTDPQLSWKYNWIVRLFGWGVGRRAQTTLVRLKASTQYAWDEAMFQFENVKPRT